MDRPGASASSAATRPADGPLTPNPLTPNPRRWQPITSGETWFAWAIIEEIERCLGEHLASNALLASDPTLASGIAGVALFYAYLDAARPGTDAGDRALDCLGESIDGLASTHLVPSLYAGF